MCHAWKSNNQRKAAMARIRQAAYHGYRVTPVSGKVLKDYAGMNHYAAKQLGFTPVPDKKEIYVDQAAVGEKKHRIIKHEIVEARLMKHGMTYFEAHKRALVAERK